ncbi:alpha/beta hydrolase [Streptomyces albus]|uniref:alpha/beta hydrolase n=1 Tax=Streptomyces albus TaxID=1888 RepID=UPI001F0A529A|nr:alpha/beta hydrolase [Streptomyces albus]
MTSISCPAGPGGPGRRGVVMSAAALSAGLLFAGGTARAQARPAGGVTLRLPAPTGPHRVGTTTLYLVDRSRRDPWNPAFPVREVMATILYPARTVRGRPLAPHMTPGAAALFEQIDVHIHGLPSSGVDWAATTTHAYTDAPAQAVRRPVLLHSPGGADPRSMGTGLAEELASHGFVVVTVDHPGDASEVEFPATTAYRDRPWRTTVFRGDPRTDPPLERAMIETRIADLRFVLDRLEALAAGENPDAAGRPLPDRLGRALDLRRVGCYGHSAGGTAVAQTLYEDRRTAAAVVLEGYLNHPPQGPGQEGELYPVARFGVDRPLLLLGTDGFIGQAAAKRELESSWAAMLAHGRTRRRQIDRAAHWVFTDYATLAPQLQAAGLMTAEARRALVGAVEPAVSVPRVRHHVRSFFARHLAR